MGDGRVREGRSVLLLHGFGGTPEEFHPLAGALAARGFFVRAPAIGGPEEGRRQSRHAWRRSAERALFELVHGNGAARRAAVVGHSLGALLALDLAQRFPLMAVVLFAPSLGLARPILSRMPPGLVGLFGWLPGRIGELSHAGRELLLLAREVAEEGFALSAPLLVVQGLADRVVDPKAARAFVARAKGEPKEFVAVAGKGHDLADLQSDEVVERVVAFLEAVG